MPVEGEPGNFVILGQIRPTPSQTLSREDQVGKVFDYHDRPLVARAWDLGEIIDGEVDITPAGEVAGVPCRLLRVGFVGEVGY